MTESGLHLVEHWKPEQTGTVVAVGHATHPRKDEAFDLAVRLESDYNPLDECVSEAAALLRDLTGREPLVKPGDDVIFSWSAGQEIFINDGEERYLLMREADLLAVIEPEVPA